MQRCSGISSALTLSCAPAMSPLQRPRHYPPADASICLPGSVPCDVGTYGDGTVGNLKMSKIKHYVSNHFTYILSRVLCPVPCLYFYRSFYLETEKSPWRPKSIPLGQMRF
ncbi:unnamed protein product [Staurois parvus]|uniref:Uncharacterized protein n=1 Tax=Staurois parvus TaxID=386267 RepID=A0ABN9EUS2_9NEOB|nr:unnamed protein product [Staurois parvus]